MAYLFDRMCPVLSAQRFKNRLSTSIFENPFTRKLSRLDFLENLLHFFSGLVGYDSGTTRIVTKLSRIGDAVIYGKHLRKEKEQQLQLESLEEEAISADLSDEPSESY